METESVRQKARPTPTQLKNLRMLRVAVCHPDDADGQQMTQQLRRIGCHVQAFWPPLPVLPELTDVVFLAVRPDSIDMNFEWFNADEGPTIIAVVNYENPTIVEIVLRIGAKATLPSPVRSFGLLSALVVARQVHGDLKAQKRQLRKLSGKVLGVRRIEEAKNVLMRSRSISEAKAYDLIREQAMSKRVSIEEIAQTILNANEILSLGKT
ncbi:Aliphatic amidase regulator [Variovorax sp. PBS-H4]|uniref:ANTAR domain-containing response regulator n=1 Tax=Variovorax sp. PBS-H4 TaxID=434008 RepID=UPI0013164D87|nr:ANTAR domain-containing protein [Variovorax sp. PBS-H4]VTU41191.1 Aliphatic amidase regulator [Variovorax sp. PBS-H4]